MGTANFHQLNRPAALYPDGRRQLSGDIRIAVFFRVFDRHV
jgi:hypothetical protein